MPSQPDEPFSLTNIPVPTRTASGHPITKGFKYRVLGFNADTQLKEVVQRYAHRKAEVIEFETALRGKFTFVVRQVWDDSIENYKLMEEGTADLLKRPPST